MNESRLTYEWVTSHIWTHVNESCLTCDIWMPYLDIWCIWISHAHQWHSYESICDAGRRIKFAREQSLDYRIVFSEFFFPNSVLLCSSLGAVEWIHESPTAIYTNQVVSHIFERLFSDSYIPHCNLESTNVSHKHETRSIFSKKKRERKRPQGWSVVKCRELWRKNPLIWIISISRDYWDYLDITC